jgi:RNase H-fold protein (predicted Holliday junction resolvase)
VSAVYLGLDLGKHRTGLAISASGIAVRALPAVRNITPHLHVLIEQLVAQIREHQADTLIIGNPLSEDGSTNEQSEWVAKVVTTLEAACAALPWQIQVILVDEFQTTRNSHKLLPHADRDSAAAALILANHLGVEV